MIATNMHSIGLDNAIDTAIGLLDSYMHMYNNAYIIIVVAHCAN